MLAENKLKIWFGAGSEICTTLAVCIDSLFHVVEPNYKLSGIYWFYFINRWVKIPIYIENKSLFGDTHFICKRIQLTLSLMPCLMFSLWSSNFLCLTLRSCSACLMASWRSFSCSAVFSLSSGLVSSPPTEGIWPKKNQN